MRAIAAGLTDIGRERNHNEDRFLLLPEFNVFVVADGMGGHQSGEVASRMAASTIALFFREGPRPAPVANGEGVAEQLRAAVVDANAKIFARADDSRAHRGMGTTVVAAAYRVSDRSMHVVHAGDSRAYHIRGTVMKQMTRDHSLLSDALLERPELTESDLAYLPKNVITRALGIAPQVDVDATSCPVEPGDVFLLCSDGLHGLVEDDAICGIIHEHEVLTVACSRLIEAANRNGGKDNITAVLIRIEAETAPWASYSPGSPVSQRPGSEPSTLNGHDPHATPRESSRPRPTSTPPHSSAVTGPESRVPDTLPAADVTPKDAPVEIRVTDPGIGPSSEIAEPPSTEPDPTLPEAVETKAAKKKKKKPPSA